MLSDHQRACKTFRAFGLGALSVVPFEEASGRRSDARVEVEYFYQLA